MFRRSKQHAMEEPPIGLSPYASPRPLEMPHLEPLDQHITLPHLIMAPRKSRQRAQTRHFFLNRRGKIISPAICEATTRWRGTQGK